ncbi:MAG TPA: acylphosphatase [Candidatus Anoxymicrobiaceae bacterium]
MDDIARARVRIRGRVQGVFFRAETRDMARRLGLSGWVMNMPDGSVDAELQGRRELVEQGIDWCGTGPQAARVEDVDVTWLKPTGESGFKVRNH